jgi:thiol:disulfide interchange protein DsbC
MLKGQQILEINPSYFAGLYEVILGNRNIVYAYPEKELVFAGEILSSSNGEPKKLTTPRRNSIFAALVSTLNKVDRSKGLKIGSGPLEIVEFTDLDCPYCRKAEEYFKGKDELFTRYVYFIAAAGQSKESEQKALFVLSATDREAVYKMAAGGAYDQSLPAFTPSPASKELLDYHHKFGADNNLSATPLFAWEGGYIEGFNEKSLEKATTKARLLLDEKKKK